MHVWIANLTDDETQKARYATLDIRNVVVITVTRIHFCFSFSLVFFLVRDKIMECRKNWGDVTE